MKYYNSLRGAGAEAEWDGNGVGWGVEIFFVVVGFLKKCQKNT